MGIKMSHKELDFKRFTCNIRYIKVLFRKGLQVKSIN